MRAKAGRFRQAPRTAQGQVRRKGPQQRKQRKTKGVGWPYPPPSAGFVASRHETSVPRVDPGTQSWNPGAMERQQTDRVFVGNAGLVLLNPYLPHLFEHLGLVRQNDDSRPAIDPRGARLLQHVADGRWDAPEPELTLNKLLCGLDPATPVEAAAEPSPEEIDTCDDLLKAVRTNWPHLRNASTDILRETFIQREGRLTFHEDRATLEVQRKTVDVLTDQIPWSFSVVFHRWMPAPIHVTW
ncbi:contractile injection system tape measure protein [Sphingomonas sp. AOB5]|uniref:contractile injection system tape measure protein n=1 Tax=Sphingomonas sp. AOB5 TaxID=3034017 RepID=UPI0023F6DAE7|nr:contractile injection system tape measure protein [Sphingomonas sp. AOB5]MDF7774698.1 contractile injection system tape measure protein [Sphingomonas sp. AOB5]